MSQWYLLRGDQTHGPYEETQVRQWVQAGQIGPSDRLCPVGGTEWQPASAFLEFATAPAAPALAGPAAPSYPAAAQTLGPGTASGLSAWITKGWEMVSSEWQAFVGATLLMLLVTLVTLGICGPPLSVGLYRMLLKRHAGKPVQATDVFEGFQYFGVAWGFTLLMLLAVLIVMIPLGVIGFLVTRGQGAEQAGQAAGTLFQGLSNLLSLAVGTITLFSMPLIADDRAGAVEALVESWNTVKANFWTYLLAFFIFQLISTAGVIACGIGMLFSMPLSLACIVACYRSVFPAK